MKVLIETQGAQAIASYVAQTPMVENSVRQVATAVMPIATLLNLNSLLINSIKEHSTRFVSVC